MKTCPRCEGTSIVSIEYPYDSKYYYDGVSEYSCVECGYREGRWCGNEIENHEVEPYLCKGGAHPVEIDLNDETDYVGGSDIE